MVIHPDTNQYLRLPEIFYSIFEKHSYTTQNSCHSYVNSQETGEVTVAATLDRETLATYRLRAHAQDRERPDWECSSELLVTLDDVNDNAPRFSAQTYSVTLPEDADIGTLVAKVC